MPPCPDFSAGIVQHRRQHSCVHSSCGLLLPRRRPRLPGSCHARPARLAVRCVLTTDGAQPGGSHATRLRVERQTHLPAAREEAWRALRALVPQPAAWRAVSGVYACLESIYRAECQALGEEVLCAWRTANQALEELPTPPAPRALRFGAGRSDSSGPGPAADTANVSGSGRSRKGHADSGVASSRHGAGGRSGEAASGRGKDRTGEADARGDQRQCEELQGIARGDAASLRVQTTAADPPASSSAHDTGHAVNNGSQPPASSGPSRDSVPQSSRDASDALPAGAEEAGRAARSAHFDASDGLPAQAASPAAAMLPDKGQAPPQPAPPASGARPPVAASSAELDSDDEGGEPGGGAHDGSRNGAVTGSASHAAEVMEGATMHSSRHAAGTSSNSTSGNGTSSSTSSPGRRSGRGGAAGRPALPDMATVGAAAATTLVSALGDPRVSTALLPLQARVQEALGSASKAAEASSSSGGAGAEPDSAGAAKGGKAVLLRTESVQYEQVSRLAYDQERQLGSVEEADAASLAPGAADAAFMRLMLELLLKASYVQFSARDAAMARSLNSDYLDQLFIRADERRLDAEFAARALAGRAQLAPEARSLLVFKRGYGQERRRGRMLVRKLDYLQVIAMRRLLDWAARGVRAAWGRVRAAKAQALPPALPAAAAADAEATGTRSKQAPHEGEEKEKEGGAVEGPLAELGLAGQPGLVGSGLALTLSAWGLLPRMDTLPLARFNREFVPQEPPRLAPVYVERVSMQDALDGPAALPAKLELVEPTFQELVVIYRQTRKQSAAGGPAAWLQAVIGRAGAERQLVQRERIKMRIYRDIPVPTWKVVFPDKLLQFRPLDGLRSDLITLVGLASLLAQAKYDSPILQIVSLASAGVYLTRVIGGYKRMRDRYSNLVNDLLAETTIAGQEGVVEYLANSASLQQWAQAALAYTLLLVQDQRSGGLSATQLSELAEQVLEQRFKVRVRYNAEEALGELGRLGILAQAQRSPPLPESAPHASSEHQAGAAGDGGAAAAEQGDAREAERRYRAVPPAEAYERLRAHWDGLLLRRVETVLNGGA